MEKRKSEAAAHAELAKYKVAIAAWKAQVNASIEEIKAELIRAKEEREADRKILEDIRQWTVWGKRTRQIVGWVIAAVVGALELYRALKG